MGVPNVFITRQEAMKVASVGFLALLALAAVTDAMVFEDDSVDPTEESSLYDHQGTFKRDAPKHESVAHMKEHHHRHEVQKHPHNKIGAHTKSTKAHAKAPRKYAATKPPTTTRHHVRQQEMDMDQEEDPIDEVEEHEEADYAPVEDEDDLHEKGQAMVESFDDDSIEFHSTDEDLDEDDDSGGIADMASAAASSKQHTHEWTPKPIKVKSDKHTSTVLATIRAMRTKPRETLVATKTFKPKVIHALAPKKAKPHKKKKAFKFADDDEDGPAAFGKVKAKGFLADRSWMLGAGKPYGGYRKTGGAEARRYKRAKGEITDFPQSDNAESSASSEYSYSNVKRAAAGKAPTVFAQELHDGAARVGAILKPKFRSMRGRFRGRGTGEEAVDRANKKAQTELKELFALGKK